MGLALIGLELLFPSLIFLFIGLSALVTGLFFYFLPNLSIQNLFFIWGILSVFATIIWFLYFKPKKNMRYLDEKQFAKIKGSTGVVIKGNENGAQGKVRFTVPVFDQNILEFQSEERLIEGDNVCIVDVKNECVIVKKV